MLGATLKYVPRDTQMVEAGERAADEVRRTGGKPYIIPVGGSNPIGALGYVGCAAEILQQAADLGIREGFGDIAATIAELLLNEKDQGSFARAIV